MPELRRAVHLARRDDEPTVHVLVVEHTSAGVPLFHVSACATGSAEWEEVSEPVELGDICPACVAELAQELRALRFIREEEALHVGG